jgi:hypothetical protein
MRSAQQVIVPSVVVAAVAGAVLVWYRVSEHNWPWQGDPARLSMCGRDYIPRDLDVSVAEARSDGINPTHLFDVYRAPALLGPQVYTDTTARERAAPRQPGAACPGSLLIKDSPGSYLIYDLSGGP